MRFQRRAVVARPSDADARTVSIGLIENASVCTRVAPLLRTVIVDRVRTSPSSPIAPVTFIETMPIAAGVGAGIDDVSTSKRSAASCWYFVSRAKSVAIAPPRISTPKIATRISLHSIAPSSVKSSRKRLNDFRNVRSW